MNNMTNTIIGAVGWVLFILTLVASYYEYAKKSDPEVADKMKHVGTFAEWAVSLQDTLDKSNSEKLASATQDVLTQAEKSGIKLTDDMAKGAVEKAVADRKPTNVDAKDALEQIDGLKKAADTPVLDDLEVHDLKEEDNV